MALLKLKFKPNPMLDLLLQIRPRIRIKKFLENPSSLCLLFPMQLKQMADEETREYHLKKLYELSLKTLGEIPQLDDPNQEQQQWIKRKMKAPASAWRSFR